MSELMDKIKNLREITGAGFVDCKKALESNDNNIEISIDFLRKKGLAKANSKLILQSSLIAPIMVFSHLKKKKKK